MKMTTAGYREISHTADWALQVWAPDLSGLLVQAARGMTALLDLQLAEAPRLEHLLTLDAADPESLLVSFLTEILYINEQDHLGFDAFQVSLDGLHLEARLWGAPVTTQRKEIKAVTYHQLVIQTTPHGLETTLVFDV
ncbi:MAG TPA: archease [Anaerolineaceae bacterium]|jgi:SHS2 domain-containing protein|nr:archease [Anaerolineaceae bacterium]